MKKKPKRRRKAVNLTLSEVARVEGEKLAELRGIKLSQLADMLIRKELREAGILPNEGTK